MYTDIVAVYKILKIQRLEDSGCTVAADRHELNMPKWGDKGGASGLVQVSLQFVRPNPQLKNWEWLRLSDPISLNIINLNSLQ